MAVIKNAGVVYNDPKKQDKITSTNKLASDLVDDTNQTNLFVTSSEKNAWSGKQDALSQTQLGAVNSGITSSLVTQIGTNQSDISGLQSSKQNTLVSGTNIKTINGQNILGSGNLETVTIGIARLD